MPFQGRHGVLRGKVMTSATLIFSFFLKIWNQINFHTKRNASGKNHKENTLNILLEERKSNFFGAGIMRLVIKRRWVSVWGLQNHSGWSVDGLYYCYPKTSFYSPNFCTKLVSMSTLRNSHIIGYRVDCQMQSNMPNK